MEEQEKNKRFNTMNTKRLNKLIEKKRRKAIKKELIRYYWSIDKKRVL